MTKSSRDISSSGKLPIRSADILNSLSTVAETRFPAAAVDASRDPAVKFLLSLRILTKTYETTLVCDRCQEACEVPIEADDEKRFFVCPTGYIERPVAVSEDEAASYRFDYDVLSKHIADENHLHASVGVQDIGHGARLLAQGQSEGTHTSVVLVPRPAFSRATRELPLLKEHLKCDKLIMLAPGPQRATDATVDFLVNRNIHFSYLDALLAKQTFNMSVSTMITSIPLGARYLITTHEGKKYLEDADSYEGLVAKKEEYDMFIDGCTMEVHKRDSRGRILADTITAGEFCLLAKCVESGSVQPSREGLTHQVFKTGREKVDIRLGRYRWRTFNLQRNPLDRDTKTYQFMPPSTLKFCIIKPISS